MTNKGNKHLMNELRTAYDKLEAVGEVNEKLRYKCRGMELKLRDLKQKSFLKAFIFFLSLRK